MGMGQKGKQDYKGKFSSEKGYERDPGPGAYFNAANKERTGQTRKEDFYGPYSKEVPHAPNVSPYGVRKQGAAYAAGQAKGTKGFSSNKYEPCSEKYTLYADKIDDTGTPIL